MGRGDHAFRCERRRSSGVSRKHHATLRERAAAECRAGLFRGEMLYEEAGVRGELHSLDRAFARRLRRRGRVEGVGVV